MRRSGFVVRFVDVVLILLFGFISISSIRSTEVELPRSTEAPTPPPELEDVVFVSIRSDGTYLVDDERLAVRGASALLGFLDREIASLGDVPVKVRIRASFDTPIRFLSEASRVCDRLGVAKAFEVQMVGAEG